MSQSQVAGIELIDGPFGVWDIAPSMEKGAVTDETCQEMFEIETIAEEKVREKRILKFCEVYVYVDQGNLSVYLARNMGTLKSLVSLYLGQGHQERVHRTTSGGEP